jgi:hypothetical protein
LVWNVEPAALMVPLAVLVEALLDAELLPVAELPLDAEDELDEEHAARDRVAATTTAPTAEACCLRPTCISSTPYSFSMFPRPREQPQRVSMQTVVCQYSLPTPMKLAGKRLMDKRSPEG